MTINDIITYFETLATEHIDILHTAANPHFFRDENETLAKLKSKANTPAVIMGPFESIMRMVNRDNNQEEPMMTFLLLDYVSPRDDDATARFAALQKTKNIVFDFIRRIKHDATECKTHNFLKYFNPDTVRIDQVGPVFDNYFGWMVDFSFIDLFDMTYDPSKFGG